MVEYASIAAGLSLFFSSLGGVFGSALPSTYARAVALVSVAARSSHVDRSQARSAFAAAPYTSPALRYFYTVGWVWSASHLSVCKAALLLGPNPSDAAAQALEKSTPTLLARLRAAHVSTAEAASAIGRGVSGGCT